MKRLSGFVFALALFVFSFAFLTLAQFDIEMSKKGENDYLNKGDSVEIALDIKNVTGDSFTSLEFFFDFSDGLTYNSDASCQNLPSGWEIWKSPAEGGSVKFAVIDESCTSPYSGDFSFTLSFEVTSENAGLESVSISDMLFFSNDGELENYTLTGSKIFVQTNPKVPSFKNLGASIRLSGSMAIRFGMEVSKDDIYKSVFSNDGFSYESGVLSFGMLSIKKTNLTGELTLLTSGADKTFFTSCLSENADTVTFAKTVTVSDKNEVYVFRPFVRYRAVGSEEDIYFYADTLERSFVSVANIAQNNETNPGILSKLNALISSN